MGAPVELFNVIYAVCSAAGWTGCLYKLRDLRRDPGNPLLRALCLLFAFPSTAFAVAAPAVYVRIDALLGVPNLATLLVYGCIIAFSATYEVVMLLWSCPPERARPRIRRRLLAFSVVLMLLVALFGLGRVDDAEHPLDFDMHYAATPSIAAFLVLYFLAFATALADLARLCWRYATIVGSPWLRRGLRFIATGTVGGLGYCALKIVAVSARWAGATLEVWSTVWAPASASLGALLITAGITMPGWGARLSGVSDQVGRFRAYRQLEPLWLALYQAVPAIALDPPARPRVDRWSVRDLRHRLYRRVIEIRDGRLALRDYLDPAVAKTAYRLSGTAGLAEKQRQAVAEAALLKAALMARAHNRPPLDQLVDATDPAGGADVAEETAWLVQVAHAFARSPSVQTVAEQSTRASSTRRQDA